MSIRDLIDNLEFFRFHRQAANPEIGFTFRQILAIKMLQFIQNPLHKSYREGLNTTLYFRMLRICEEIRKFWIFLFALRTLQSASVPTCKSIEKICILLSNPLHKDCLGGLNTILCFRMLRICSGIRNFLIFLFALRTS